MNALDIFSHALVFSVYGIGAAYMAWLESESGNYLAAITKGAIWPVMLTIDFIHKMYYPIDIHVDVVGKEKDDGDN